MKVHISLDHTPPEGAAVLVSCFVSSIFACHMHGFRRPSRDVPAGITETAVRPSRNFAAPSSSNVPAIWRQTFASQLFGTMSYKGNGDLIYS